MDETAVAQVQTDLRRCILRAFAGRGLIEKADAKEMLAYQHSGFSVVAGALIPKRTTASPWSGGCVTAPDRHSPWIDCAKRAQPGTGVGVPGVVLPGNADSPAPEPVAPPKHSKAHYLWAVLIAHIYEVFPLLCPLCGGQMRLIAFITECTQIRKILDHIGGD